MDFRMLERGFFKALEAVLVFLLASMVAMVFGNVLLRWFANSGLDVSEELSRFFFVWLTFIGAVVVMRENAHLGVDALVGRLGDRGRLTCMVLSDVGILLCCAVFFWGTWQQAEVNRTNYAPVTGLSMLWIYGVGFFTSLGIGAMVLSRLVRAATGRVTNDELRTFAGEFLDTDPGAAIKRGLD